MTAIQYRQEAATTVGRLRSLFIAAIGYVGFVLAVYWPEPRHFSLVWLFIAERWTQDRELVHTMALVGPIAPHLLYFACAPLHLLRNKVIDLALLMLMGILSIVSLLDLFITPLFVAVLSTEAASTISFLVSACCFAWIGLLCVIGGEISGRDTIVKWVRWWIPCVPIIVVSVWSIMSGVMAAIQASWIAGGQPYCIVTAKKQGPYEQVDSLFDLRGTNFFTDRTGYKDDHRDYFHAVLIFADKKRVVPQYRNWSIGLMSWQRMGGRPRDGNPDAKCKPEVNFLSSLRWF